MLTAGLLVAGTAAHAQYKGARDYFPKNQPIPGVGEKPAAPTSPPAAPQHPTFKSVPVNAQFYFLSDTNRAHPWTKISTTTAKNSASGVTRAFTGSMPVQQ